MLGESNTPMDPEQVTMIFADLQAKLEALTQTVSQTRDRMSSIETGLEN